MEHPEKESIPIAVTLTGKLISLSPEYPKADSETVVTLDGIVTDASPEQLEKAYSPIFVTVSGITTFFKPLHPEKTP